MTLTPDTGVVDVAAPAAAFAGRALSAIRSHLGTDVAFITEAVGNRRVVRHVDAAVDDPPVRVGDVQPLDGAGDAARAVLDLRDRRPDASSHVSVPIRLPDGSMYGTLGCTDLGAGHVLSEWEISVLRVVADMIGEELDGELSRRREQRLVLDRVRPVVDGDGLEMVFQPIVDLQSGRARGFEALARFLAPPRQPPDAWFRDAASVGLGLELELAAIRSALTAVSTVAAPAYVSVNASPTTVVSGELHEMLGEVQLDRVVVEITENAAVSAYDEVDRALSPYRSRGLRLAVDDAGAGYASLRHILRLHPDIIKLDVDLIRGVDHDAARRSLVAAFLTFAGEMDMTVVAEGIETARELGTLRRLGVRAGQGFHLGMPAALRT